jgi:hypothetical protein
MLCSEQELILIATLRSSALCPAQLPVRGTLSVTTRRECVAELVETLPCLLAGHDRVTEAPDRDSGFSRATTSSPSPVNQAPL